jgi:p-methyltransferase
MDCLIIGYYEAPLEGMMESAEAMQEYSGAYRHLLANTVPFRGRRVRYPEVLNASIEAATGRSPGYHVGRLPNLGACYLASFLRQRSFTAEIVNFVNHDRELLVQLLAEAPRAVAITTTFYFDSAPIAHLVELVRRHSPGSTIVVGGPHVFHIGSDHPVATQDYLFTQMGADVYVHDSQGELTLSRICAELRRPSPDLSRIPNLIYADGSGGFERTGREVEDNDLDENAVDWSTFDRDLLVPSVQLRTARSCAYKCAFCRYPVIAGALALTNLEVLEREFDTLAEMGVSHLMFIDDTFNIPKNRFKDICRLMIEKRYGFNWFSYFRCANADDEVFDLAAESGCRGVFLGIESGDQQVLRAMEKAARVEKYRSGIRRLKELGVITYASFIVGFPGETEESARNTVDFIREVQPHYYSLECYFHDLKVPIAGRAGDYGLTGQAYSWQHRTMDWRRAQEIAEEGYREVEGSTILPLYSFDIWSIGYLLGQGVPEERIHEFLRLSSELLVDGLDPARPPSDFAGYEEKLAAVFRPAGVEPERQRVHG